jgi:predicted HD superfamily hydrolase involved in NAD metabolism
MGEKLIKRIKTFLAKNLELKKYRHTLGVADICRDLAQIHGADTVKAYISGLLHDAGRVIPIDKYPSYVKRRRIKIGIFRDIYMKIPFMLHGIVGMDIAREKFGIRDTTILNDVKGHTTGRRAMKKIEKILYLADMIAPDRRYPWVKQLRCAAYRDLNKAMLMAVAFKIENVLKHKKLIFPETVFVWNELVKKNRL